MHIISDLLIIDIAFSYRISAVDYGFISRETGGENNISLWFVNNCVKIAKQHSEEYVVGAIKL